MIRNEPARKAYDLNDRRPREVITSPREHSEPRTIVIRQGSGWQSLAFLCLCLLLLAVVLMGHLALRGLDMENQKTSAALVGVERKLQQLEAGLSFDAQRRQLLLGMRDHILKVNPRVSLTDAYRYAELALEASEKYPAVDPLFLLAIGTVESGYDSLARSPADARGLYQIWPSTGRLLTRALGWAYDENTLYDPEKNTLAAALYLDMLFSTYSDPQMVLAEYNGGPLNAGYFRAGASVLAGETRNYVPRVLELHARLREQFDSGTESQPQPMHRDAQREGKTLEAAAVMRANGAGRTGRGAAPPAPEPRLQGKRTTR